MPGLPPLRVGSVNPENKSQITSGFKDLSPSSIRYRFSAVKKEVTPQELQYFTEVDGQDHYALGIEERGGKGRGIAVVRLVRSTTDQHEAEVAVTIIDEYQRRGLGTLLINLIILAALERDLTQLSFTYMPQNLGIKKLLNKVGQPVKGQINHNSVQVYLMLKEFAVDEMKTRLKENLPVIEEFSIFNQDSSLQ